MPAVSDITWNANPPIPPSIGPIRYGPSEGAQPYLQLIVDYIEQNGITVSVRIAIRYGKIVSGNRIGVK